MIEAEKKAIYDKGYAKWLKYYKNEFKEYCSCSKLPVTAKQKVVEHIKAIFDVMKECGVCMYPEKVKEPMEDVASVMLKFGTSGDPESIDDFTISTKTSCWRTVMFEKTPDEIEAAARKSAQHDVEHAEWKEKQEAECLDMHCLKLGRKRTKLKVLRAKMADAEYQVWIAKINNEWSPNGLKL